MSDTSQPDDAAVHDPRRGLALELASAVDESDCTLKVKGGPAQVPIETWAARLGEGLTQRKISACLTPGKFGKSKI